MARSASRFGYLDSLRFIAAAVVVLQHLTDHRQDFLGRTLAQVGLGHAGVVLFFCISGFVVPLSVGRSFHPLSFAVKRWFRLYPLYLAALALLLVVGGTGLLPRWGAMWDASAGVWIANLLLVQDFVGAPPFLGVSWTLIIEILWYTLFGVSLLLFGRRAGDVLDALMVTAVLLIAATSLLVEQRLPLGRPLMLYATVFGYQCYRYMMGETSRRRFLLSVALFSIALLVAITVGFAVYRHPFMSFIQTLGPWIGGVATFLAVLFIPRLREARLLAEGWLPMLGTYSYSIYLLHPIAIEVGNVYFEGPWRMPVALTLLVPLVWIGFRKVETPMIALGRDWGKRIDARVLPAA